MLAQSIRATSALLVIAAALNTAVAETQRPNLLANGAFEESIEGWNGLLVDRQRDNERIARPDFVEHVTLEPETEGEEPRSALQITLDDLEYGSYVAHQSGVHVAITESAPAGGQLRVAFDARTLAGSNLLRINRVWGGSSYDQLAELTEQWERHEVILSLDNDTSHLVWTLVEGDTGAARNRVAMGRCQIDNVHISVVPEDEEG